MGWLCSLPWALGWLWGFGASTGTAGTAGGFRFTSWRLLRSNWLLVKRKPSYRWSAGARLRLRLHSCAAARLRAAWVIHTLKVVHRLDAEPLSKKSPWIEKA